MERQICLYGTNMDIKLRQSLSIIKPELNEYAQCNPTTWEGTWENVQQFCLSDLDSLLLPM